MPINLNRRNFLTLLGGATLVSTFGVRLKGKSMKQPVLFLGHGSPMNAIEDNGFTRDLKKLGQTLAPPKAILMISAHWETKGTWITGMDKPKTIHDFYGFPQKLFQIQYPAPGQPKLAEQICTHITEPTIHNDSEKWGLDHGCWSVLVHMFPKADIPVLQLSLDMTKPWQYHYDLGTQLKYLREQGVLIMGSGNIVHNLRQISWDPNAKKFDWAIEFDQWVKQKALARDFNALINQATETTAGRMSIPTPEHYLPLLYILGASDKNEELVFDIEEIQNASIAMRSFRFG